VPVREATTGVPELPVLKEIDAVAVPLLVGVKVTVNDLLWPDCRVSGSDSPLRLNSVVLVLAEEIVTLPPLALNVSVRLLLEPTATLPKSRLLGETANWPTAAPVPDSAIDGAVPVAFETTARLPLALPAESGANTRLKVKLCPADSVKGKVIPLTLKPLPVTFACEMVTLEPLELLKVACLVLLSPTCTLPKDRLDGLTARVPAAVPVPDTGTVRVGSEASLVIMRLALLLLADCGANTTLNEVLLPAPRVIGRLSPLKLNPDPETVAWLMVTLDPPLFVKVACMVCVLLLATEPKLKLEGETASVPAVTAVPDKATVRVGVEASDVTIRLPLAVPAAWGAKVIPMLVLPPAASVTEELAPLRRNPVPVTLAELMVTLDPPLLVIVADCCWVLPTCTDPKETAPALSEPEAAPMPLSVMLRLASVASLEITTLPVAAPADCGANLQLNVALWPAARALGILPPFRLNPLPVTTVLLMLTVEPPELVTVTD